jgi:ArsR family transcriptional regulator, cadmium/lead-responsive transcriptional repressor
MARASLEMPFLLPEAPAEPDLVAKYFRVLSDPTRVRVLKLLDECGELSVGELVERLGESQPKVSNHLACLRWCGFVERERHHPHVFYRVADDRVLKVLELARALLADNAEHVASCRRVDSAGC